MLNNPRLLPAIPRHHHRSEQMARSRRQARIDEPPLLTAQLTLSLQRLQIFQYRVLRRQLPRVRHGLCCLRVHTLERGDDVYEIDHRFRPAGVEVAFFLVVRSHVVDDGDLVADMVEQATEAGVALVDTGSEGEFCAGPCEAGKRAQVSNHGSALFPALQNRTRESHLLVGNVLPSVIEVVANTAEAFVRWRCMVEELDKSLENIGATVAFYLVTGEKAVSNIMNPPFKRRVSFRRRYGSTESGFEIVTKIDNLRLD